jgi:hypothetical protein
LSVSSGSGTTATLSRDWAGSSWTTTGTWFCIGYITYPC